MAAEHWFEGLAEHMGPAYLRYSFTMHTGKEVDFLVEVLGLEPGDRVLDVGCGPGRHCLELARRGIEAVGVDISQRFLDLASEAAAAEGLSDLVEFHRVDARDLAHFDAGAEAQHFDAAMDPHFDAAMDPHFDAAIAMCQGAFGLQAGPAAGPDPVNVLGDRAVLAGMAAQVRSGGKVGVAAFSAYFQVQHLDNSDFDALSGTNHELTEVRDEAGVGRAADLWTTCFTPRELWMLASSAGLEPLAVHGVSSVGDYSPVPPNVEEPEFFLVAQVP